MSRRRQKVSAQRALLQTLVDEVRALRLELERSRSATERNIIWTAQAARGKDSAGNWR